MDNTELISLLAGLRGGGKKAFEEIYEGLKTPVYTVILRIVRDRQLAEDILQEVFVKLYRSPPDPTVRNPRAYILRMARNLAIDGMRRQPRLAELQEAENAAAEPVDVELRLDIDAAMSALTLGERELVSLHLNGGLTFRETADILGEPLGTVLWRYRRAIGKLRTILSGGTL